MKRFLTCLAALLLATSAATADTVIVDEDFESYSTVFNPTAQQPFWNVWEPITGGGLTPTALDNGFWSYVIDGNVPEYETAFPAEGGDGLGGSQAADFITGWTYDPGANVSLVHQYTGLGPGTAVESVAPSATQSVVLSADIFDLGATGNKRATVALRNRTTTENLLELGFYNTASTSYMYRAVLFDGAGENPSWQEIAFDPALDDFPVDEPDGVVSPVDIGEGWHRYTATITPTDVTITVDLFRNGINEVTEAEGVDFEVTIGAITTAAGFDSLRFGGPSGLSTANTALFDNISLTLVDVAAGGLVGDYNGDGTVDAADYTVWRDTLGDTVTPGEGADGNNNGFIDSGDYDEWVANFGATSAPSAAGSAPEPAAAVLLALAAPLALRRRGAA